MIAILQRLIKEHGEEGIIFVLSKIVENPTLKLDLEYALSNLKEV